VTGPGGTYPDVETSGPEAVGDNANSAGPAVLSPREVTLRLAGGVTVLWGAADHAQAKAEELALLLPTHASYYDVSAPGTAVTN
jgi:hypothetical protein